MLFTLFKLAEIGLVSLMFSLISYFFVFKKDKTLTFKATLLTAFLLVIFEMLIPLSFYFILDW